MPSRNHAIAHLHGQLEPYDDCDALDLDERLSQPFEAQVRSDWRCEHEQPRRLAGIVGFRLRVERVELKFKLSQNHPAPNIAAVAGGLDRRGEPMAQEIACLMRATLHQ